MLSDRDPQNPSLLADDLRAAAIDLSNHAARQGIAQLAHRLDQGEPLIAAVQSADCRLPVFYRQALVAAAKTGDLPLCLTEMARYDRVRRNLRGTLLVPLAYAAGHFLFFVLALIVFGTLVGDAFQRLFDDFDLSLPPMTQATLWFATTGVTQILQMFALSACGLLLLRLFVGPVGWRLFLYSVPGVGPLFRWLGTWQLLNLVHLLIARAVPLPEALATAADGVSDANVAATARRIAEQVSKGSSFARELADSTRLARSTAPLIRWGEDQDQLETALRQASDLLEGRIAMHAAWLRTVIPPVATVLSGGLALLIATSAMLPLYSLINNLT